ncbi:MAG: hypothetical protein HYX91_02590 [Chloroflexi bacterium]|nr:hypothetical protein [Chloroflexota bacterium]
MAADAFPDHYVFLRSVGAVPDSFSGPLAALAGPLAAFTVKKLESGKLKLILGLTITLLGAWRLMGAYAV